MANDEEAHDWGDEDDHTARAGAYVVLVEFVTTERADPERARAAVREQLARAGLAGSTRVRAARRVGPRRQAGTPASGKKR